MKATLLVLATFIMSGIVAQSKIDTSRGSKITKPIINNGTKITAPPKPVINASTIPTAQQTATGMIYDAPKQGKDVRIEITGIDDISTSTQNKYLVKYKLINGGTEDFHTGYTRLRSYLYTNSGLRIPTGGDTSVIPNPQRTITAGTQSEGKLIVFSQFLYTNVAYKVVVLADANNELAEADETNNTAEKSVTAHIPPPATGTVTDIDGNIYHTIQIGTKVWMVENLKTTRLNDGTPIIYPKQVLINNNYFGMSSAQIGTGWGTDVLTGGNGQYALRATNPSYCYYNDDANNNNTYGKLYNWYAVTSNKLAPAGWHVATGADWDALAQYASDPFTNSMRNIDRNIRSTSGWGNSNSTNITGFTALPAGGIYPKTNQYTGSVSFKFENMGIVTNFWSYGTAQPIGRQIGSGSYATISGINPLSGYSVRCVKD